MLPPPRPLSRLLSTTPLPVVLPPSRPLLPSTLCPTPASTTPPTPTPSTTSATLASTTSATPATLTTLESSATPTPDFPSLPLPPLLPRNKLCVSSSFPSFKFIQSFCA